MGSQTGQRGGPALNPLRSLTRPAVVPWLFLLLILGWSAEAIGQQLTATWVDGSADELGFSVERASGTTGTFAEIGTTGPGITVYTDATIAASTTYCYRVRAYNATAYSAYSNVACGTAASSYPLTVVESGTGSGAVISQPSGIICGATCTASFASGMVVMLTATPATGVTFTGWGGGGGCTGTGTCTVTLAAATTVTATFTSQSVSLGVSLAGTGTGTVASTPAGISCGATCTASFANGTAVTLTATPGTGATFTGWSGGGCSGTGTCTVSPTSATTVRATFTLRSVSLTVSVVGPGTVARAPTTTTGTTCPKFKNCSTTSVTYLYGTMVTLTATPAAGFTFNGWSGGACTGAGSCTVTLTSAASVTAKFVWKFWIWHW